MNVLPAIDIFLSRKSQDAPLARPIYQFLTNKDLTVFESDETLPRMGNSDYRKAIDQALDQCRHLIVVGSRIEFIQSSWVEAEWGFFIGEKRAGRKPGNLLTVITSDLQIEKLPPSLRNYEVVYFDSANFEKIYAYVFDGKGSNKQGFKTDLGEIENWYKNAEAESIKGEFSAATQWYRKAAESGHAASQYALGVLYDKGQGVEQNIFEAYKWYRKAAELGNASAQAKMGFGYHFGIGGLDKSYKESVYWYQKAADQGNIEGQNGLGLCYEWGTGVKKDEIKAMQLYALAAKNGDQTAARNLEELINKPRSLWDKLFKAPF